MKPVEKFKWLTHEYDLHKAPLIIIPCQILPDR